MTVFWFIFTFGYIIPFLIVAASVVAAVHAGYNRIPHREWIQSWNDLLIALFFMFTPIINTLAGAVILYEFLGEKQFLHKKLFKSKDQS